MVRVVARAAFAALLLQAGVAAGEPPILHPDDAVRELSGLAVSRADPGVLWTHNDSLNPPELFALDASAHLRRRIYLQGLQNLDWEDIAAFDHAGKPALLLADIGDNFDWRTHLTLYALSDPGAGVGETPVQRLWTLDFQYPDGPRDAEALAVDEGRGEILIISKRDWPPHLYRLPLPRAGAPRGVQTAQALGVITTLPPPRRGDPPEVARRGRFRSMVTALSFSADRSQAAVLTATRVYLYAHRAGESWDKTFARKPRRVEVPYLPQQEAVSFAADGRSLFVGSEAGGMPHSALVQLPLPP